MRFSDLLLAFPAMLLALLFAAVFQASTLTAMAAIGIALVPVFARVVRGATLQVLQHDYVTVAHTYGSTDRAVFLQHVLPNIGPVLIVQTTVAFGIAILAEAALSYLGLGTPPPTPSWGRMLSEAQTLPEPGTPAGALAGPGHRTGRPRFQPARRRLARRARPTPGRPPAGTRMSGPVLVVEDLTVRVGAVPAVYELTFSLAEGQRVGLIGESGSGKTLTALAVMGLLPESLSISGHVRYRGRDLLALPEAELGRLRGDRLAMIFQEPVTALNPVMTVGDQVAEPLRIHGRLGRREANEAARALLARVQLPTPEALLDAYPHQLSGGQRQRVMIAMAMACAPDLLIADEPTTALDVTVQAQILDLLTMLVADSGSTLLLITHDLAVVDTVCDRVLVLYGGRLVEEGSVAQVFGAPRHPYTSALLEAIPRLDGDRTTRYLPAIPGTVPALGQFPPGCPFRNRCPRADGQCAVMPPLVETEAESHRVACWHPIG